MTAPKKPTNEVNQIIRLRDEFSQRARKEQDRAHDLENQARQARQNAQELARQASVMNEAYHLIQRDVQGAMGSMKLDELSKKDAAKIGKTRFVFLVDGSGSMNGRPINNAIDALGGIAGKLAAQGAKVETILFGDKTPFPIDIQDTDIRERAKKGLNCGTDMVYAVDSVVGSLKKTETTHVIVVSDGDLFDGDKVKESLEKAFVAFPKATLDVVQLSDRNDYRAQAPASYNSGYAHHFKQAGVSQTAMAKMIETLQGPAVRIRPQLSDVVAESASEAIGSMLAMRLSEKAANVNTKPTVKKQAPGK